MAIKTPNFSKFMDNTTNKRKAVLMDESTAAFYQSYFDSPFTISSVIYENDKVVIRKYIAPKVRLTSTVWLTHVLLIAMHKVNNNLRFILVFGPVHYTTLDKFDDRELRRTMLMALRENWKITF